MAPAPVTSAGTASTALSLILVLRTAVDTVCAHSAIARVTPSGQAQIVATLPTARATCQCRGSTALDTEFA